MILEKHLKTKRVGEWLMVTYLVKDFAAQILDDRTAAHPVEPDLYHWLAQRFPRVERSAIPHWLKGQDQLTFKASEIPAKCTLCGGDGPLALIPTPEGHVSEYACSRCIVRSVEETSNRICKEIAAGTYRSKAVGGDALQPPTS